MTYSSSKIEGEKDGLITVTVESYSFQKHIKGAASMKNEKFLHAFGGK